MKEKLFGHKLNLLKLSLPETSILFVMLMLFAFCASLAISANELVVRERGTQSKDLAVASRRISPAFETCPVYQSLPFALVFSLGTTNLTCPSTAHYKL